MMRFKDMAKRSLALVAVSMAIGASGYAVELNDMEGHWAEQNVNWMVEKEFLSGYKTDVPGVNSFMPNNPVTRGEFAAMVVKAGTFDRNSYRGIFEDIDQNDWHAVYVQTAYDKGWIKGIDGKFKPDDKISRAEMGVIMGRIVKPRSADPSDGRYMIDSVFEDRESIPIWAKDDLAYVLQNGVMRGTTGNRFAPENPSTRAESATVIYNTLNFFGNV
jgi:hypothetical protein